MKILAIADEEARYFYDAYTPGKLDEFDLILACGDLKAKYLEFLATMAHCPLLYVRGNHDDRFSVQPPEGCICIEDMIYEYKGVRILGLGGSYRYRQGDNMYTEKQMKRRIHRVSLQLWKKKGFDILLTHAPAYGVNDLDNVAHRGFECFLDLLNKYRPKYFIHGHVHMSYDHKVPKISSYGETTVINAYEYCKLEYDLQENEK